MRFFQGVGAASIGSLNVTLIGDLYSGNRRGTAMGYNGSVLSIGTAAYPAIGGALASVTWYYPFLLPLLGVVVGLVVIRFLHNKEPESRMNLKQYLGKTLQSMMHFKVIVLYLSSISFFIIIYGAFLTYFPFLMRDKFGSPVFIIGIVMSSTSVFAAITASQLGRLTKKISYRNLLLLSFGLYIIILISVPFVNNILLLLIPAAILGVANGLNMPVMQTILAGLAPAEQRAAFMSVNGMVLRIGQTIGPLYTGLFYGIAGLKGAFFLSLIPVVVVAILIFFAFREG